MISWVILNTSQNLEVFIIKFNIIFNCYSQYFNTDQKVTYCLQFISYYILYNAVCDQLLLITISTKSWRQWMKQSQKIKATSRFKAFHIQKILYILFIQIPLYKILSSFISKDFNISSVFFPSYKH
ncbi:hypothetical protein pb186bvf_012418 [Paramecium bursaria]